MSTTWGPAPAGPLWCLDKTSIQYMTVKLEK